MVRFAILLCIPLAGVAQTPSPLLNGDPLACFAMEGAGSYQLVSVDGMPFNRAMRVRTGDISASANPWDIRPRCFNTLPARKDDTVLATFWMRTRSGPDGRGFTTFVVEKGASPYTKSVQYTAVSGAEWKKFEIPFTMLENYTASNGRVADGYNLSFWVVFPSQEIEIGGFTLMDYGPNVPYSSLNLTNWPYEGHAADAAWRKTAAERIERIRKTDIVVVVRDEAGNPIPNAAVRVKMKRHAFGFGTAIADGPVRATTADGQNYREWVPRLFNKIVTENVLKWPFFEQSGGRAGADAIFAWLPSTGITAARGHNVIWPGGSNLPADVQDMLKATPVDKDKLRQRIDAHIREVMTYAKGKVTEWDVLNEPYTNKDIQAVLGDEEMVRWFQIARDTDPGATLYINDYDITEGGGYSFQHINGYYNIIRFLLDRGAPVDGIGLQGHFNINLTPPDRVYEILDLFAGFGKDLQVTEFDVKINDEQLQADYTRDYLTLCFSHPAMKGFMLWGFWAGAHWLPASAMLALDWSPRPVYTVWNDLIYKQWWTDVTGTAGQDGIFRTRGFLGDYDVEITANGQTRTLPLSAVSSSQPAYAATGKIAPGVLTADGIVNAASFARGAVAPGEVITLFGSGFGPKAIQAAAYDASGRLPFTTGDTRVLFDGVAAPMIYSLEGQVSAIVPYSIAGTVRVEVEYLGTKSNAVSLPVASAAPGLYCYTGGQGPAVVVNNEAGGTSFNSSVKPAARGSYVTLFVTGEGELSPAWTDGTLPVYPDNPRPQQELKVYFGGVESNCPGNWAGLIYAGVLQVNACVPEASPVGPEVSIQVTVGSRASQTTATVAIR